MKCLTDRAHQTYAFSPELLLDEARLVAETLAPTGEGVMADHLPALLVSMVTGVDYPTPLRMEMDGATMLAFVAACDSGQIAPEDVL